MSVWFTLLVVWVSWKLLRRPRKLDPTMGGRIVRRTHSATSDVVAFHRAQHYAIVHGAWDLHFDAHLPAPNADNQNTRNANAHTKGDDARGAGRGARGLDVVGSGGGARPRRSQVG